MAKTTAVHTKPFPFLRDKSPFLAAAVASLLIPLALWSLVHPWPNLSPLTPPKIPSLPSRTTATHGCAATTTDPPDTTFYDDPSLSYSFGSPLKNWDEKRQRWLHHHPSFAARGLNNNRVVLVTSSQPSPCRSPIGDHLLLRLFKNKVDYGRIHGHGVFYNNAFLHREITREWAKLPPVRAAMVAHPEAEWVLWLDSDVVVTDMEFKIPFERYGNHNLVISGWENLVYEERSWLGFNTGVMLIRNCQWSVDFLETWASLGPMNPKFEELKEIVRGSLKNNNDEHPGDDQSALVYLMLKEREKWEEKVYIENRYSFNGYWVELVDRYEKIEERDREVEVAVSGLRRRRGEAVSGWYGEMREAYLKGTQDGNDEWRRPFITHFMGCDPCKGKPSLSYGHERCWNGIERALNFADSQVLRNYGFVHESLWNSSSVSPLKFDF